MPTRRALNYLGIPRWGRPSVRYSLESGRGRERLPNVTVLNKISEFFTNNVLAWFIHTWRVKDPFPYPKYIGGGVYDVDKGREGVAKGGMVTRDGAGATLIAVAADWATDTLQSEFIGQKIGEKNPDYTIHLGDTYFSGTEEELTGSFGGGEGKGGFGLWPRGRSGSFALIGNHEMYSSGAPYLAMINDPRRGFGIGGAGVIRFSGQGAPCFALRTKYWLVLGLDTGYDSLKTGILQLHPNNTKLRIPDATMTWLKERVLDPQEKRGIIVLTHHQYVTAFHGEDEFINPARQLKEALPGNPGVLWIWGHEHRFSMYGKNQLSPHHIAAYGRCIGNGGMPDEHTPDRYVIPAMGKKRNLVLYDKRVADSISYAELGKSGQLDIGYNGYAMIRLEERIAEITYYASYKRGDKEGERGDKEGDHRGRDEAVFCETWEANINTGYISNMGVTDLTLGNAPGDRLSYHGADDPALVSR